MELLLLLIWLIALAVDVFLLLRIVDYVLIAWYAPYFRLD